MNDTVLDTPLAGGLDNRGALSKAGFGLGQQVLDKALDRGDLHLKCKIRGLTIGYCYIRKNACSSFKRLFLDHAPVPYIEAEWGRKIDFLCAHMYMRYAEAAICDRLVFVYRDPVKRIVSAFKNKFIQRDGHEDFFRRYPQFVNSEPGDATFRSFVTNYLQPELHLRDRHVHLQSSHLKSFRYTDAIPMEGLHARMTAILGPELADAYFAKPVNATAETTTIDMPGAADMTADALHQAFAENAVMPSEASLLTPELEERLRTLYAEDYRMIARIGET